VQFCAVTLAVALAIGLVTGCASLQSPFNAHLESSAEQVSACARWYLALESEVDAAGVRDAQDTRIQGFPYLRVNRFMAALRAQAADSTRALHQFTERLAELDVEARRHEMANLSDERMHALPGLLLPGARSEALVRTRECARLLREIDLARPEARERLLQHAVAPDDYSVAQRMFGLYALTQVPFAQGVRGWEDEVREAFRREPAQTPGRVVVRHAPPAAPPLDYAQVAALLARSDQGPLGIPEPTPHERELLFAAHAPSYEIAVAGDQDRFGRLRWLRDGDVPAVEASEAVVYTRLAHTLYRGRALLQLVYTIWFPERPPQQPGDILAGTLDGVIWRVTLAPDGEPLLYDTIHPCGCFHMFFPTPRAKPLPAPDALEEWAFAPQPLPRIESGRRPVLRISSGTHSLERVTFSRGIDSLSRYLFRPEDELRSLVRMEGGRRSVYGSDGLIAGTERLERTIFWPMGIVSAGTMRQWGHHATAFVGRRHFDDADLLEKRFMLELQ